MNQTQFEKIYEQQWQEFGLLLDALESKGGERRTDTPASSELPARYRKICNHYGLARSRHYSPALVDRLHRLVQQGHNQLYRRKRSLIWHGLRFIASEFPRTVRTTSLYFWISFLLFFGSGLVVGTAAYRDPLFIYSVMSEGQISSMESMYDPAKRKIGRSEGRDGETDFAMFGYYIFNNISIGFRTFAGGIVFGIGSVFFLLFNGITIGAVAGHLSHPPYASTFWQFVSGHGAFELTAIVICGAAGLLLGKSLLVPGNFRRTDSLKQQAPVAMQLVIGSALMLVCAAFIEAFWSSSRLEPAIKYSVAGANWILVAAYLIMAGRGRDEH